MFNANRQAEGRISPTRDTSSRQALEPLLHPLCDPPPPPGARGLQPAWKRVETRIDAEKK